MRRLTKTQRLAGVAVAVAATFAGVGLSASSSESAGPPPLPTAAQWAAFNVTVTPTAGVPAVPADAAAAAAHNAMHADVLNGELDHCKVPGAVPALDQDCYVELVNPAQVAAFEGSPGHPAGPVAWAVALVDPNTGKPLLWFSASQ